MSGQTEYILSYFLHGSILCLGIYMSVIKPSICFSKRVISAKWRNKFLIHNVNLTVHRKSACFLRLLVFLETWVDALFSHWRSQVFPKDRCRHDLKGFCESEYNNLFRNIIENMKKRWLVYYLSLLFTHLMKGPWITGWWNQKYLGNRLWTSVLVRVAISYQTLLSQTESKPYCSKYL